MQVTISGTNNNLSSSTDNEAVASEPQAAYRQPQIHPRPQCSHTRSSGVMPSKGHRMISAQIITNIDTQVDDL